MTATDSHSVEPGPEPRPADNAWFEALQPSVIAAASAAGAPVTAHTNVAQWRFWEQFCGLLRTKTIRSDPASNSSAEETSFQREVSLLCRLFVWRYQ